MKLSDFKYPLPRNHVARHPARQRDQSRLMVLTRAEESIENKKFHEVLDHLSKGDCLVINETRVVQARLFGKKKKTNARIEVFLLRELNAEENIWDVIVDPGRKVRIGNKIFFDNGKLWCEVIDNTTSRGRTVRFKISMRTRLISRRTTTADLKNPMSYRVASRTCSSTAAPVLQSVWPPISLRTISLRSLTVLY